MIAYDSNIVIYAFEADFDANLSGPARNIVVAGERDGAVLSVLLQQEVLTGAAFNSQESVDRQRSIFQAFHNTSFMPVTLAISDQAIALSYKYGKKLKGYDAIHLATAIKHGAEVFYTNDNELLKCGVTEINVRGLSAI